MTIAYIDHISDLTAYALLGALIDAGAAPEVIEAALSRRTELELRILLSREERHGETVLLASLSPSSEDLRLTREDLDRFSSAYPEIDRLSDGWTKLCASRGESDSLSATDSQEALAAIAVHEAVIQLQLDRVYCTSLPLPSGLEPNDATVMDLMHKQPVQFTDQTIPTSALGVIALTTVSDQYSLPPAVTLSRTGCGGREIEDAPGSGLLRLSIGELVYTSEAPQEDSVMVVETNIDDMNPQNYGHVMDLLLETGALDVTLTPIIMKKGRPGNLLSVLVDRPGLEAVISLILQETTTIGVRTHAVRRRTLDRKIAEVATPFGTVRIKVVRQGNHVRCTPEYDDCREAARAHEVPITEVQNAARRAADAIDLDVLL
ncbi:MAG: LarC family nickel insertion protein [Candidatus Latescibacteria bacterium]|jgi:pyridinium-3,5-bisthiocarboxylic acid mononucleotide nickel chelatase|nr:LarC family nickel insertion protein [Candidatus Latescibacterota bacterium]